MNGAARADGGGLLDKLVDSILEQLRTAAKGRAGVEFLSYSRDFEKIWSSTLSLPKWKPDGDVFVIWDGIPHQDADPEVFVRDFLTVYDWAAAMALSNQTAPASQGFGFRLHVLEIEPSHRWRRSFSVRAAPLLVGAMPWMKSSSMREARRFIEAAKPPSAMPDDSVPTLAAFSTAKDESGMRAANLIRDLWKSALIKPGVGHSASNAIGPAALAQYLKADNFPAADFVLAEWFRESGSLRPKFWRLLEIVGLLRPFERKGRSTDPQSSLGGLADRSFVKENMFGQFTDIRFALVDDQAGAGFHDVLSAFLLGHDLKREQARRIQNPSAPVATSRSKDGHLSLTSFERPEILLDWLVKIAEPRGNGSQHRPPFGRHSLYSPPPVPASAMTEFDILFLDLRLHGISGAPSERDESKWIAKLLTFVQGRLKAVTSKHRPTDAQEHALRVATAAAAQRVAGIEDDETIVAQLALLPIAISICDPTAPIVLFSSTRQRAVIELLQPFPNIITKFAKPALTGYGEEDQIALESLVPSLERALIEALEIHEKRCLWDLVTDFGLETAVSPPCVLPIPEVADMPSIGNRYLANANGRRDLPFFVNEWYTKRFRWMISDYITGDDNTEHIYRPYEFLESSLSSTHHSRFESKLDMQFHRAAFGEFVKKKIIERAPARALAIEDIKKARHKVVHGSLGAKALESGVSKYIGLIVFLKFLFGIHNNALRKRLNMLYPDINPLVRVVTTGIFTREDQSINVHEYGGALARSVVAQANQIWPWTDNQLAETFMAVLDEETLRGQNSGPSSAPAS